MNRWIEYGEHFINLANVTSFAFAKEWENGDVIAVHIFVVFNVPQGMDEGFCPEQIEIDTVGEIGHAKHIAREIIKGRYDIPIPPLDVTHTKN